MTRFVDEVREQPAVVRRLLAGDRFADMAERIRALDPVGFMVAARGSSDNAALYAKYLFEARNRLPVALAAPSLFTHYRTPPRLSHYCVIGISQSGASPDVVAVLAEARRQGAFTIALTSTLTSPLGIAADAVIDLATGPETSVPASKTFTASLFALALLSAALDPEPSFSAGIRAVADALEAALQKSARAAELARDFDASSAVVLGRGFNLATAAETALKLTETAYVLARAWSIADFLHGPIAIADARVPALLVGARGPGGQELDAIAGRLAGLGCHVTAIIDGRLPEAAAGIELDSGLPEALSPLPLSVIGQLLANALAERRGYDPDRPRSLTKVTRTW